MKEIKLTQGKVALVDDGDYAWLNNYQWYALKAKRKDVPDTWYAVRWFREKDYQVLVPMHRFIALMPPGFIFIDHRDYDGLNNQRANLRPATNTQNQYARRKPKRDLPRGVGFIPTGKRKYTANICVNQEKIYLGVYFTAEEAHQAYREANLHYFGEFSPFAV